MKRKISLFLLIFVTIFSLANLKVGVNAEVKWQYMVYATDLHVGDQIVIASYYHPYALSATRNEKNIPHASVNKTSTYLTVNEDIQIITLEEGSVAGSFAFNVGNGYLAATSSTENTLQVQPYIDDNASWKITIGDATTRIFAQGSNTYKYLRYDEENGIFTCFNDDYFKPSPCIYKCLDDYYTETKSLFKEYYNNGSYTKESVLNVNTELLDEVSNYFHASASVRYRKTVYTLNDLTMYTSVDGLSYDESSYSKYENVVVDGVKKVYHSGLNNPYYVDWTSVEDKFITLFDLSIHLFIGWKLDSDGAYYFNLRTTTSADSENRMTMMAREFVAPMWLAPNAETNNFAYIQFSKITVQEINDTLVIKLYVSETDSGKLLEGSDLVFSQVTITKN